MSQKSAALRDDNFTRHSTVLSRISSENSTSLESKELGLVEVLSKPNVLGVSIFLLLQMLLAITGNLLVLRTIRLTIRFHSAGYYFIASLATADLLVGVLVIPVSLLYHVTFEMKGKWIFGIGVCDAWILANMWFCMASIFSLCAVTWDRYVAVTSPLKYFVRMRNKSVIKTIVATWSLSLLTAIVNSYALKISPSRVLCEVKGLPIEFAISDFILMYLSPLILVAFVNILIVKAISRHSKQVQHLAPQTFDLRTLHFENSTAYTSQDTNHEVATDFSYDSGSTQTANSTNSAQRTGSLKREMKTFRTFLIVTGSFFFSWTPFFFILLIDPMITIDGTIMYICVILTYINSATNPLVYGIFNRDFRQAMLESLRSCYTRTT